MTQSSTAKSLPWSKLQPPSEVWHDAFEEGQPLGAAWGSAITSPPPDEAIPNTNTPPREAFEGTTVSLPESKQITVDKEPGADKPPPSASASERRSQPSLLSRINPARWRTPRMPSINKKFCWALSFVCVIVAISLIAASLKKVSSTEQGVQYNRHKKQLENATKSGGLLTGPPGFRFIKFPSTFITVEMKDRTCVSNDGLLVTFSVTFQYQMTAANVYPAILKYRNFDKWASTVEQAGLSAIHHSCSDFVVSAFQNKRGIIQSKMEDNLKAKLEGNTDTGEEGVHAVGISLQLTYVHLPEAYNNAVAEKQAAEEDIALAIAQRKQETTKANTALLRAKEEARKILDTANNEAEVLLTEARLKAEETLYSFQKEAEALVEVKQKLNLTTEGVLAYLSNRLLAEANTLKVTTGEPAKLSRRDEL